MQDYMLTCLLRPNTCHKPRALFHGPSNRFWAIAMFAARIIGALLSALCAQSGCHACCHVVAGSYNEGPQASTSVAAFCTPFCVRRARCTQRKTSRQTRCPEDVLRHSSPCLHQASPRGSTAPYCWRPQNSRDYGKFANSPKDSLHRYRKAWRRILQCVRSTHLREIKLENNECHVWRKLSTTRRRGHVRQRYRNREGNCMKKTDYCKEGVFGSAQASTSKAAWACKIHHVPQHEWEADSVSSILTRAISS